MLKRLTTKQAAMLQKIVNHNEYGEKGCLDNLPWSWAVVANKSEAGVLGTLQQKGYVATEGSGQDATVHLTEAGIEAYLKHFGAEGTWRNSPPTSITKVSVQGGNSSSEEDTEVALDVRSLDVGKGVS